MRTLRRCYQVRGQWSNTNQSVKGIGIVHAGIIDRLSVTFLFTMTALDIVDGHTFEILKKGAGSIEDNQLLHDLLTMPTLRGPNRKLEDFPWPPPPDAVMGLREPTRALLAASLDKVLPKLLAPRRRRFAPLPPSVRSAMRVENRAPFVGVVDRRTTGDDAAVPTVLCTL
jgi:hypothetical protein